MITHTIENARF